MNAATSLKTPRKELRSRVGRFQDALRGAGFQAALILHNPNLFYYTGTVQDAYLYIPGEGEPVLWVRKNVEKARADSLFDRILPIKSPREIPDRLKAEGFSEDCRLGMEYDVLPVSTWRWWRKNLPLVEIDDLSGLIWKQRAVKSPHEIEAIRMAGKIVVSALEAVPSFFQPGMTESALSAEIVNRMRLAGHPGFIRTRGWRSEIYVGGTVSAGESSAEPWPFDGPVGIVSRFPGMNTLNSDRVIGRDEPLLIDMLGGYNGYYYDFTRAYVRGSLEPRLKDAHATALAIRDQLVAAMRPGALPEDLYATALRLAEEAGFKESFMNHGDNQVRFVGHGIGLELDEAPVLARRFRQPLEAANVVALEPKFIFPGLGGVGLEDTIQVTDQGGEILVPSPSAIIDLPY